MEPRLQGIIEGIIGVKIRLDNSIFSRYNTVMNNKHDNQRISFSSHLNLAYIFGEEKYIKPMDFWSNKAEKCCFCNHYNYLVTNFMWLSKDHFHWTNQEQLIPRHEYWEYLRKKSIKPLTEANFTV